MEKIDGLPGPDWAPTKPHWKPLQLNSCISALGYLAEDWPKVCKGKTSGVGATFECEFQADTSRGLVHVPNVSMRFSSADTKFITSDTGVLRKPDIQ